MPSQRTIDFRFAPVSSWTCIGRPDDPYKTLVDEEGRLLYDFQRRFAGFGIYRFNRVVAFAIHTDVRPEQISQTTESARVPVVITTLRYPKATLTLHAFGHQHDDHRRTDIVLWTITPNPDVDEFMTALRIQVQTPEHAFVTPTRDPHPIIYRVGYAELAQLSHGTDVVGASTSDKATQSLGPVALVAAPDPLRVASAFDDGPASGLMTPLAVATGDQPLRGALFFPQNHEAVDEFSLGWAEQALADERRFWTDHPLHKIPLEVPDPDLMDMLTSCARNILQAREIKNDLAEFQVGPTVYRGLWVVDGHFLLEAAHYLGHRDDAYRGVDALLRRARPDGSIAEFPHHTKETGIALATLVRQCELMGDWQRLDDLWPIVQKAVDHIETLRAESRERGPSAPEYGLMAASFGDGGLGGKRPEYTTSLWTLIGLKEATRAARRLGHHDDAARFQAAFDDLMQTMRTYVERDAGTLPDGTPYFPMNMPGSGDHLMIPYYEGSPSPWEKINPGTGTWALAQAIYPGELFAPDDPIVLNFCHLLEMLDDEEGFPIETGWLPYKAMWNYAASFNAHVWLYAGRPDKAVDYLYAFANHATPTRVWREEQSLRGSQHGQKVGDMPHNWASAEFIRLVRNLLVFERGETLELLPGVPQEWLAPGATLRIETPTRFGTVKLRLQIDDHKRGELEIETDTASANPPQRIVLHVPAALGFTLGRATHNGQAVDLQHASQIELGSTRYEQLSAGQ